MNGKMTWVEIGSEENAHDIADGDYLRITIEGKAVAVDSRSLQMGGTTIWFDEDRPPMLRVERETPPLEEPTNQFAVIRDDHRALWCRVDTDDMPWRSENGGWRDWGDLRGPVLVYAGVEPA